MIKFRWLMSFAQPGKKNNCRPSQPKIGTTSRLNSGTSQITRLVRLHGIYATEICWLFVLALWEAGVYFHVQINIRNFLEMLFT